MIDQFTKWVEMAALPEQSALLIAQKFIVHFIVTFGCPLEVYTDQGRNFDGNLFKALCEILEVAKTRTTPYHPSSNGQVERYNTIVVQMIRCYIQKKNKRWDIVLPLLSMALHSMVNRLASHRTVLCLAEKRSRQYSWCLVLFHGHFHIGLVFIPRLRLGMITKPIWKCPCINLYIFWIGHKL